MSEDRKRPGVAFWASVVLVVLPMLYVLSFGPACWISERTGIGNRGLSAVYQPMLWIRFHKKYGRSAVHWYAMVGTRDGMYGIYRNRADGWLVIRFAAAEANN